MHISVTGRHMEITDAIRDYASEKVAHALGEFPRVESVHVILDIEKFRQMAEVVVQAKNHIRVDARDESEDMYVSIDGAVDKAQTQLRRLRDKVQDHKSRDSLAHVDMEMQAAQDTGDEEG